VTLNTSLTDPAADSYISLEEATAYFSGGLMADDWTEVANQEAALREAARWLNTLPWVGECCVAGRYLAWPRQGATCCCEDAACDMVPAQVRQAQAELALQLGSNPALLTGGVGVVQTGDRGPVKRQKLGDLEQEFFDPRSEGGTTTSSATAGQPTLLQKLPWLADMLNCWVAKTGTGSSRIIGRVRS
jgi:hypothetical protein